MNSTATARGRFVERLERALARCSRVAEVADVVFAEVRREVPNVFACVATTDPLTGVITWAYKSHPLPIGDTEFAAAEYGDPDVNRFVDLAAREVPVGVLSVDTGGDVASCRRLREYMTPVFGFTDELRLVLRSRGLTWGDLALYRGAGEEPFTEADGARLAAVGGVVAEAIRRALFSAAPATDAAVPEPAVVIVGPDGHARDMTRAARDRIADLGGYDHGALPAGLLAVAASARSQGMLVTRTQLASGQWLTLRGSALAGPDGAVVVTIDLARPSDLTEFALAAHGLTAREQEIVALVAQGASTKVISSSLHLSLYTVQDHLKAIFAKLGVNSRREMIARLYG